MSLDKLVNDLKFLDKVRQAALSHKDDAVPNNDGTYYQSMMWTNGVIAALKSEGYVIEKKVNNEIV